MSQSGTPHRSIVWSKQKLDELDAILSTIEGKVRNLQGKTRAEAEHQLERIRTARDAFKDYVRTAENEASTAVHDGIDRSRQAIQVAESEIEREWEEASLALQKLLNAASDNVDFARDVFRAQAQAEREALKANFDRISAETSDAMENIRSDLDDALQRLSKETARVEARAGEISSVGAESWQIIRQGISDAHAVNKRTTEKVAAAFERLR